jgi:hypothetical protein
VLFSPLEKNKLEIFYLIIIVNGMHRQLLGDSQTEDFPGVLPTGRHPTVCEEIDKKKYNRKTEKSIQIERNKRCTRRIKHPFFPCDVNRTPDNVYIGCRSVNTRPEKIRVEPFSDTELKKRTQTNSQRNKSNKNVHSTSQIQTAQTMTRSTTKNRTGIN